MGLPLPGNTWSPSNLKCLHSFHLHTFGDLVYWDRARTCWSWREINGPQALQGALNTLTLPANTAIPLLPRQAWHFSSGDFLSWATDATEILSTSCVPSTWRHFLTVIYRRWHLLHPAISPPQGTILRTPSRPMAFQRSSVHGMLGLPFLHFCLLLWSSHCRGGGDSRRPLLPHCASFHGGSLPVGALSPFVLCWPYGLSLASPEPSLASSSSDQTPHHVYLALHTSTGFSPL